MTRVMFHSEFDPLPRKSSLRGLTVFVSTVVIATAVAVHGFVESTLGPRSGRPVVETLETQVLEPPAWMQQEPVPVQQRSTTSRRRTTLHTTCPIGASPSLSLSSRTRVAPDAATSGAVAPSAPPACPSTGASAGSPAGLSSGLSGT
jgi:hypothetical protein